MEEKKPIGCPPKYTPERCAGILRAISKRIPYQIAAEGNGIGEETLYRWLRIGRTDLEEGKDTELARFWESIKKTELEKMEEHIDNIRERPDRWQADAWILERRWHKHFSSNAAIIELNKRLDELEKQDKQGALTDGK